jgi:HAE1 family hydrophobic/amphiphilic exporter-1
MLKRFIKKPVLATVISIILVILGTLALFKLPLQQFPDIAPPCVVVNATYPGANAETILRSVAPSLEEAINGVENMTYMTSTASNDGTLAISVFFKLGTNPDQAAVNVQNRVSQATAQLPPEVVQQGIVTAKQMNGIVMGTGIYSDDEKKYNQTFLSNYTSINIIPELKRITGVGSANIFGGSQDYSMRIWLKPAQMETYHVSPKEITDAIQDKSLESAPGRFGDRTDEAFEYVIKYKGKLNKPEEYGNIAIRTNPDGSVLRLKDVARIEFGSFNYATQQRINGHVGVGMPVIQLAGSNSNQIQIDVNKFMGKIEKKFPAGIHSLTFYSTKRQLDASIEQVEHTLIEAFILVFIVVYLFLQDFRSTLIPAIAVPVAIVGTFFFMYLFGFTINLLTLFALVLSIGIVVDDAIVVVEAVHAKMENFGMKPKQATVSAMHDITGAIISITLVMAAVFLPVGFMEGSTGLFYRQFAFTMAIAIMISALNALTLSPALAALFLKNVHHNGEGETAAKPNFKARFFNGFNGGFNGLTNRYLGFIKFLVARKWVAIGGLVMVVIASVWMIKSTPTGFIPSEDQGFFAVSVSLPSATSLKRTEEIMLQAEKKLHIESGSYVMSFPGFNMLTQSASPSAGVMFVTLKDPKERGKVKEIAQIMANVQQDLSSVKGASFFLFTFPTVPGFSNVEALDVVLQDRSAGQLDKFAGVANSFIAELNKQPSVGMAFTSFKADYPQYQIEVDDDKAGQLGVSVKDALQTVQSYFGTAQAGDFNRFGKYYRVVLQADSGDKRTPEALKSVYVKNSTGEMVPLSSVVKLTRVFGSETASRYNLFNSIELNVIPKKGHSSGEVIEAIKDLAAKKLPADYSYEFSGQTREEISSGGQSAIIFIMSLVFVYFLLAAQYESYILPLAVICSIPTGVFGVFALIGLKGIENNIYVQVALIMLIGLLAKNAILIVEFAVQRRRAGLSLFDSALEAAKLRLRPIIMTSLAFIFGLFPLSIASGPSAQGNHSISYSAAGGMISGVVLGLLIIPVLFIIFQGLHERVSGAPSEEEDDDFDLEPETKVKAEHATLS